MDENMKQYGPTQPFSDELHAGKYRQEGEDFREAMNRVANGLKDNDEHFHELRNILLPMRFMPAGRIQASVGSNKNTTPYNCFVSGTIADSFVEGDGSIMQRAMEAATTMRMGGGIGYDFSTLRPKGDMIVKLQSRSSGPISFMEIFDAVCRCTASSGHRRGAQMGVLRIDHPDIFDFVHAKQKEKYLEGFNISIGVTDEFMEAKRDGKPFQLRFGGKVYREVDPNELWETIMRSTWDWAEPGVLFVDTINKMNNLWYEEELSATNPCVPGETPILTKQGHIPIAELVGTPVEVWNGQEWSEVTPFSTGENPLVTVSLDDGTSLECTPYHGWYLADGTKVEAKDLKPGDALLKAHMPVVAEGSDPAGDGYSQGFYSGDGSKGLEKSFLYLPKLCASGRLRGKVGEVLKSGKAAMWYHGPMLDKEFVPVRASSAYCLDWLAGLIDSDGCSTKSDNGEGVQITSVDREFLLHTHLMLTRLGVTPRIALNRPAGVKEFNGVMCDVQSLYSLQISPNDVASLVSIGLSTTRVQLSGVRPQRDARRFVRVVSVEAQERTVETFCFTEPKRGRGVFNGVLTAQCGEQPLPPFGACLLGSFNLVRYVRKTAQGYEFDWAQFEADLPPVVRAMDNVVDRARYPLPEQEVEAKAKRRMGLGVTGLANAGEALGFPYGSEGFLAFEERVLTLLRDGCYRASALLAQEKGAFPMFDKEKYLQGEFIKTLPEDILELIREHGIRNSHLTSIAPTGTISLAADNISSAIEPVFSYGIERTVIEFDGTRQETLQDYGVRVFGVKGKRTSEVTIDEHLSVMSTAARLVDSAVSKTCNVDPSLPWEEFKRVYDKAWELGCKGITTYNSGGRRGAILVSKDEVEPEVKGLTCEIDPASGRRSCE